MRNVKEEVSHQLRCCTQDKFCEGSACMAWVWAKVRDPGYVHPIGVWPAPPEPTVDSNTSGHCGLVK